MSESSKVSESGKAVLRARQRRRLAAALRENLKRRKAQAKGRVAAETAIQTPATAQERSPKPHDSAGIADDKRNG
jgi:hypothetical protein